MKVIAIIQARLNSSRLPGKILMPLAGKPMLWHIAERVVRAESVDGFFVAVPMGDAEKINKKISNGDISFIEPSVAEDDLIGRFYSVASGASADIIVRLCADNPFIEPAEIDRAVEYYLEKPCIFVSNMHQHSMGAGPDANTGTNGYPDGIGCEVFSMSTLTWMHEYIKKPNLREHPHLYFHENGLVESPRCPQEFARPDLKLDVNTEKEYMIAKDIYDNLWPHKHDFHITDYIEYMQNETHL